MKLYFPPLLQRSGVGGGEEKIEMNVGMGVKLFEIDLLQFLKISRQDKSNVQIRF